MYPCQPSHHPRMADDLKRIIGKMEASFKTLAAYMTDMKMQELDKKPNLPKLMEFL